MSRFWGWAPGLFLLSLLTQLLDATVLMASSSSWGGRVDDGWVTCQSMITSPDQTPVGVF